MLDLTRKACDAFQVMSNYRFIETASTYATVTQESAGASCHWQVLNDGKEIVSLNIGRIGIHLSPLDALRLAEMITNVVEDFHASQGIATGELELAIGLRQSYAEPDAVVEFLDDAA